MDFISRRLVANFDKEYELYRRGNRKSALFEYFVQFKCTNPFELPHTDFKAILTKPGKVIEGPAILIYDNFCVYVGETINNQRSGHGYKSLITNTDLIYIGSYSQDRKSGKGDIIEMSTGDLIYRGDWHNGKKHGKGFWKNKEDGKEAAVYEGEFANDLMHGAGVLKWSNGDKYEGRFINGKRSGHGVMNFENGDKYEDEFLSNKLDGNGTYTWKNGEVYQGKFEKGKPFGPGAIQYNINVMASGLFDGIHVKKGSYVIGDTELPVENVKFDMKRNII